MVTVLHKQTGDIFLPQKQGAFAFPSDVRLQDNIKWRYNENQHLNGAADCCIFQSTALFEFAVHYTKKTTINMQILCRFQKNFFQGSEN